MATHPQEIDKYKVLNHLGSGHFGNVYQAEDRALDSEKAIKILDVPDPQNFLAELEEAQILNKCKHKHIVEINDANVYKISGKLKVVIDMEIIKNGSLEKRMKNSFVSVNDATKYLIDILFALEFAHQQGILHRDIKPDNIMLTDSYAKLSDFGLATNMGANTVGSAKGYITHLPPEYFTNNETNELSDIFAAGVTLFRVTNNISNWSEVVSNVKNYDDKIQKGKLLNSIGYAPYIPSKIKRIINKSCHSNPKQRYQTAQEMRQALEKLNSQICWEPFSPENWTGECCTTGSKFEIEILKKRNSVNVDVKKNGRRDTNQCEQFQTKGEASEYMFLYIANSTFE